MRGTMEVAAGSSTGLRGGEEEWDSGRTSTMGESRLWSADFGGEGHRASGAVGLREDDEAELPGGEGLGATALPRFCCMRQWILNQLERRPYREPDLDMPTMRHLRSRHALQAVRFFLLMTHW